VVGVVRLLL